MHYSLCDIVSDIYQNSVEAGAKHITVDYRETTSSLSVRISDDGKGMSEAELERAKDPFYSDGLKHSHRKVGLGLPFLIQAVEQTGGSLSIKSRLSVGSDVDFMFDLKNIDTPPIGDVSTLFLSMLTFGDVGYETVIFRGFGEGDAERSYSISRLELIDVLGDFNEAASLVMLRQFLRSQEEALFASECGMEI